MGEQIKSESRAKRELITLTI